MKRNRTKRQAEGYRSAITAKGNSENRTLHLSDSERTNERAPVSSSRTCSSMVSTRVAADTVTTIML